MTDGKHRSFLTSLSFQSMGISISLMLSPTEPAHALGCPRSATRDPRGSTADPWRGSELPTALAPPAQPGHPVPPVPCPAPQHATHPAVPDPPWTLIAAATLSPFNLKHKSIHEEPASVSSPFNIWNINKRWTENGISLESRKQSALPLTYFSVPL